MNGCKHRGALFIQSESGTGVDRAPWRKHASVCPHCGEFIVWINGVRMTFALVSDKQVAAAGRYAAMLREAER